MTGDGHVFQALGTPLIWTTSETGRQEYHYSNKNGSDYWLVELDVNCTDGKQDSSGAWWFEWKAVLGRRGASWERFEWEPGMIQQTRCAGPEGGSHPFGSQNHVAKCGFLNIFEWGQSNCVIVAIPDRPPEFRC